MADEVRTDRLLVRHWTPDDLPALVEIFAKPEVWRFPFGRGWTAEETEAYLAHRLELQRSGDPGPSAVEERSTQRLLGYIHLSEPTWLPEVMPAVEIGWRLDPERWGQGLATEGARALLDHGFAHMELTEILSIYEPDNIASGRVMEKLGMTFSRDTLHPYFARPLRIYRISRAEWEAGRA